MTSSSFPIQVLQHILSFVPLKDRLGNCSLVSRSFHEAAAAATCHIRKSCDEQQLTGLASWLRTQGNSVTSLEVLDSTREEILDPFVTLPPLACKQLRKLDIYSFGLYCDAAWLSTLQDCPGLTCVCLTDCALHSSDVVSALSVLVHLEDLCLAWEDTDQFLGKVSCTALLPLVQLKRLYIGEWVDVQDQQSLSTLTSLQRLVLQAYDITAAVLAGVHHLQQLTELALDTKGRAVLGLNTSPDLAQATSLLCLELVWCKLDARVLAGLTQLTSLTLRDVTLLGAAGGGDAGAAALLAALSELQQLQELSLGDITGQWPPPSASYAALTASSRLQSMTLAHCNLPPGVWQHVFSPAQQRPALQHLEVTWKCFGEGPLLPPGAVCTNGMACISRSCAGLEMLDMHIQPDAQLAVLSQLTALTHVSLVGTTASSIASLAAAAASTVLQSLGLWSCTCSVIQEAWLLPLTALRSLTRLACIELYRCNANCTYYYNGGAPEGCSLHLESKGTSPDVWQQLLERCTQDSSCLSAGVSAVRLTD